MNNILAYSLGAVDLQINGCLGLSFNDLHQGDEQKLKEICRFLFYQGVDGFLPTLVTTDSASLHRSMSVIVNFMVQQSQSAGATILGLHLEGPFLHPDRRGAHPQEHLLPLNPETLYQTIGEFAPWIKIMTLAPELDGTGECIKILQGSGIRVSMGHTTCTLEEAQQAIDRGIDLVTHVFNAMPGLHHRQPGLLGAVLTDSSVWCGLIADGVHVHPKMVDLVYRLKNKKLFLVSDALAPYGLPDGTYPWDHRSVDIKQGTARLRDETLAGTTLSILDGVTRLVEWQICTLTQGIELVTEHPRQVLGNAQTCPALAPVMWFCREDQTIGYQRLE